MLKHEAITKALGNNSKVFPLFVDNLPEDLSIIGLKDLFSSFENVLDAYIPNKLGRKFGKKNGFIKFVDIKEDMKAVEHMNAKIASDYKLQVTWAKFKKRLQPRGIKESNSPRKKAV